MTTIMMNSTVERSVIEMCTSFACNMVREMAERHGLDAESEIRALNLDTVKLARKTVNKHAGDETTEKKVKEPKAKRDERNVPKIQLPFCGVILDNCCNGIRLNHALYTQCLMEPKEDGLCKTCKKQADQNASGKPTYGLIQDRIYGETRTFKDPKGKNVVPYANVMSKLKVTREEAETEAARMGWTIPDEEFVVSKGAPGRPKKAKTEADMSEDKPKKQVGRPKKEKKVVSGNEGDNLIAKLVAQAKAGSNDSASSHSNNNSEDDDEASSDDSGNDSDKSSKNDEKDAAKASKKADKEAAKAAKKAEKKAEKEAAKAAEKAAKKAEKDAEKATEKAAKDAEIEAKNALKAAKEAAKAIKDASKAEKEATKAKKEAAKAEKDTKSAEKKKTEKPVEEETEKAVKVKKFEHKGVTYAKSKSTDGIVYDLKTQEPVGKWNTETESIDELEQASSSEEESEAYSSDSDDE